MTQDKKAASRQKWREICKWLDDNGRYKLAESARQGATAIRGPDGVLYFSPDDPNHSHYTAEALAERRRSVGVGVGVTPAGSAPAPGVAPQPMSVPPKAKPEPEPAPKTEPESVNLFREAGRRIENAEEREARELERLAAASEEGTRKLDAKGERRRRDTEARHGKQPPPAANLFAEAEKRAQAAQAVALDERTKQRAARSQHAQTPAPNLFAEAERRVQQKP